MERDARIRMLTTKRDAIGSWTEGEIMEGVPVAVAQRLIDQGHAAWVDQAPKRRKKAPKRRKKVSAATGHEPVVCRPVPPPRPPVPGGQQGPSD